MTHPPSERSPGASFRAVFRGLALLLGLVLAGLTLMPGSSVPAAPGGDKLHHLLAFGSLAFVGVLGWPRRWVWVVAAVSLYGGMIELIQPHVGRSGEWGDWVADTLGALLGGLLALGVVHLRGRTRNCAS
jgi:hypothetical protein